jgi:glycosyltransferase involved in cell wall biosynthesis
MSPRILGAIARHRPDVVIASAYSIPTVYASAYCAAFGRPLVIHSIGTSQSERIIGHGQALARKVLLRRASYCAAGSVAAAERLQELGVPPGRIFMSSHTTDLEPLWAVGRERAYGERDVVRVLGVGRLIARKGFDRLLRAVAAALQAGAPIELRIVGTGPDEASLRVLAGDLGITGSVRIDGFVDQAALPAVYAEADVFAFPTLREPFGFVLLEAAAAGLPAIASPEAGSTEELIEHEQSGLVVGPNDVEGMAQALVRLSRDPSLRERLGRAAHEATLGRTPSRSARGFLEAVEAARGRGRRLTPA